MIFNSYECHIIWNRHYFIVFKNQKKQTGRKSQVAVYVRQSINSSSEKRGEYC